MPPTPAAFRALLLDLDATALTAFVAAVYAARGWAVDRDGDDLRVRPGGERDWLRLVVVPEGDQPPARADRVVVPTLVDPDTDADGHRVIDAADLLELAWYAVGDAERTRLFHEFFDRDPAEFGAAADATDERNGVPVTDRPTESPTVTPTDASDGAVESPDRPDDVSASDDASASDRPDDASAALRRRLAVAVVVLFVVGGVAVAVGSTFGTSGDGNANADPAAGGNATADEATADASTDDAGLDSAARERAGTTDADVMAVDGPLPPGVGPAGIENASALVDAHEAALDGRSYRLSVVAREFVGGSPTAVARERTVVESPARYRSEVRTVGTFRQEPRAIGTVSTYANGTTRFVRLTATTDADGTIRFTERGTGSETAGGPGWRSVVIDRADDPFANRTATHLRGVLDVDDAAIVGSFERDGTTYVWIDLRRRPPGGTDAIDSILVDEHGLVHEMRHEYAYLPPEASTVRTVVTVRIEPGNVTATPPPWL